MSPKRFLQGLLTRSLLLLAAATCLNLLVDPYGAHGTRLLDPIVLGTRGPKLSLYQRRRPAPAIVILGSSRSFNVEPGYIEARTSRPAFNAAVHGAGPGDYLDLAGCFAGGRSFPSILLVGLGVEQLLVQARPVELPDPLAGCRGREAMSVSTFARTHRSLFTLAETWASLRVLGLELGGRPAPRYTFASDGMIQTAWKTPLEQAVDDGLAGNWRPSSFDFETLHAGDLGQIEQLLELSRDRGARVIVYLPPYQPRALSRYLKESRFPLLRAQLLDRLASWQKQYPLKFYDFTEVNRFGGRADMFYDASHPREDAYRLMVDAMLPDLI